MVVDCRCVQIWHVISDRMALMMANTLQTSYLKVQICFFAESELLEIVIIGLLDKISNVCRFRLKKKICSKINHPPSEQTAKKLLPPCKTSNILTFGWSHQAVFWKDLNGYKGSGFYFETQVLIASWQQSNQGTSKFMLRSKGQCLVGKKSTFSCLCSCLPPPWGVKIASGALLKSFGRLGVGLANWALRKQGVSEKQRWICFDTTEECRL